MCVASGIQVVAVSGKLSKLRPLHAAVRVLFYSVLSFVRQLIQGNSVFKPKCDWKIYISLLKIKLVVITALRGAQMSTVGQAGRVTDNARVIT